MGIKSRKNGKPEQILEVALDLFSKRDYADVSIKEIAQASNSTYSLVYYYYKSKKELFHSCVKWAVKKAITAYEQIDASNSTPAQSINMWLDLNIKLSKDLKKLCRIMLESSGKEGEAPNVEWYVRHFYKFEKTILEKSIRKGVDAGVFKCEHPEEFAAFISTGIDGIYYGALTRPGFKIRKSIEILRSSIWVLLNYDDMAELKPERIGR